MNNLLENAEVQKPTERVLTKRTRKYNVQPVYAVIAKARAQFFRQIEQNTEVKRACIKRHIYPLYDDSSRFWCDLLNEANDLLDSRKFNDYCNKNRLNPDAVAEHIIFEGKATKRAVQKNGPEVLGTMSDLFREKLIKKEDLFISTSGRPDQGTPDVAITSDISESVETDVSSEVAE